MVTLLIVAHEPLASALAQVARHVYPECAGSLATFDVPSGCTLAQAQSELRQRVQATPGEVLIAADVFGATPCNAARDVARELGERVRVVAGANVPMLWRTLCYREQALADVTDRALAGATQGVMHVSASSAPSQGSRIGNDPQRDDPKRRHDQQ